MVSTLMHELGHYQDLLAIGADFIYFASQGEAAYQAWEASNFTTTLSENDVENIRFLVLTEVAADNYVKASFIWQYMSPSEKLGVDEHIARYNGYLDKLQQYGYNE